MRASATLADVLRYLHCFELTNDVRTHQNLSIFPVVTGPRAAVAFVEACGVTWCISENGGGLMVEKVNARERTGELARAVPTSWFETPLNAATIAARVCMALRGEDVDFDFRIPDEDSRLMLRGGDA